MTCVRTPEIEFSFYGPRTSPVVRFLAVISSRVPLFLEGGQVAVNLMAQFFEPSSFISLGPQQFAVLEAYRSFGRQPACAADVYMCLRQALGRDPRLPTVYKAVTKLRDLGLLEEIGETTAENGGRPRRLFRLTPAGHEALSLGKGMLAFAMPASSRM